MLLFSIIRKIGYLLPIYCDNEQSSITHQANGLPYGSSVRSKILSKNIRSIITYNGF